MGMTAWVESAEWEGSYEATLEAIHQRLLEQALSEIDSVGVPSTRDGVLLVMAQSLGTSSALDVDEAGPDVTAENGGGALLLTDAELVERFGSAQPSLEDLSNWSTWGIETRSARCAIVGSKESPTHLVLAGLTGD